MKGKLKFVDGKTGNWGFIIPDDGSPDLHFVQRDVGGGPLVRSQAGVDLEFDIDEDASGRQARRVRLVDTVQPEPAHPDESPAPIPEPRAFAPRSSPGDELSQWAYMVFHDFVSRDGRTVPSDLPQLAKMALEERWYFGAAPDPDNPHPILENYLKFTFFRLRRDGKVAEVVSSGVKWAVFNTGLLRARKSTCRQAAHVRVRSAPRTRVLLSEQLRHAVGHVEGRPRRLRPRHP